NDVILLLSSDILWRNFWWFSHDSCPSCISSDSVVHVPNTARPKPSLRYCSGLSLLSLLSSSSLTQCIQILSTHVPFALGVPSSVRKRTVPAGERRRVGFGCLFSKSQPDTTCGRCIAMAFNFGCTPCLGSSNHVGR